MSYLLHPSSIGLIMTEPKLKSEAGGLSQGAKTYLNKIAKELAYGFREQISSKPMQKGTICEDESIALFNRVFFTQYTKHVGRIKTDLLSGEADIVGDDLIIDIKTAWSLATFPATPEDAHSDLYEWQGRAYLHLYNKPRFELAYCLVDSPEDLCQWEQAELHLVSHIPENMRVTIWRCDRDMEKEERMLDKCRKAQQYITEQVARIQAAHQF